MADAKKPMTIAQSIQADQEARRLAELRALLMSGKT